MAGNTYYSTGTVSVANGGTTVTGSGTAWASVVQAGDLFLVPAQGLVAMITAVASNTSITIDAWPGTTISGAAYKIVFASDAIRQSERARQVLEQLSAIDANGRGLFYGFSTTTADADPGAGVLRLNNATIASATAAYLDNLDANGATVSTILDTWDDTGSSAGRGQLWVRQIADPSIFHAWNVTGSVVDGTGYRKLTLSYIGGSGAFADADEIMVQFVASGGSTTFFTEASSSGPAQIDLAEDTDNGTNKVSVKAPSAITSDRSFVLPDTDVTLTSYIAALLNSTTAAGSQAAIGVREVLTANRTYYVRTDGSDSNNGLADTSGGAFLTIQKAVTTIIGTLDLAGYTVTIQIGDGTYTAGASFSAPWTGGGAVTIRGNSTTPANVLVSVTGNAMVNSGTLPGTLTIRDMKLTSSGGALILNSGVGLINYTNIDFGSSAAGHVVASGPAARISCTGNYAITGGSTTHNEAIYGGLVLVNSRTVTITGTPAFSSAFAFAWRTGSVDVFNNTYSGSATGTRYNANMNGVIIVGGGGATYLPGDASGSTATGGQYA